MRSGSSEPGRAGDPRAHPEVGDGPDHRAGDLVLGRAVRDPDRVNDEFGHATDDDVLREIESAVVRQGESEVRCTVSVGIAAVTAETGGVVDLVEDVDRALYAAKRAGRNRVESSRRVGSG